MVCYFDHSWMCDVRLPSSTIASKDIYWVAGGGGGGAHGNGGPVFR